MEFGRELGVGPIEEAVKENERIPARRKAAC